MAGFEAKFHRSWQRVAVLKTATADKLKMRNEEIMKPLILKQGSFTAVQNKLEGAFKIGIRPQALGSRVQGVGCRLTPNP